MRWSICRKEERRRCSPVASMTMACLKLAWASLFSLPPTPLAHTIQREDKPMADYVVHRDGDNKGKTARFPPSLPAP